MIEKLQVYISDNYNPYENLAVEKIMFDNVSKNECILYLWQNKNTVVIGRNQNPWAECDIEKMKSSEVFLARRLSGGGAVYHDLGNLNFTFIMHEENYNLEKQLEVIKKATGLAGIDATISGRNDILVDGRKFSGNAFYNSNHNSYHHGTILINVDKEKIQKYLTPNELKMKAKGVKSVKSRVINLCEINDTLTISKMKEYMISSFCEVYGFNSYINYNIPSEKICEVSKKFSNWDYLYANTAPFSFSCNSHFEWGSFELMLDVKNGMITSTEVYTDSMDWTLPDKIKEALTDCRFDKEIIKNNLMSLNMNVSNDLADMIEKQKI